MFDGSRRGRRRLSIHFRWYSAASCGILTVLALASPACCSCSASALPLGGGQFGYRDAGHFYYPLYQRVQAEWQQGRWPLWEPEENSGIPLLGNPTAAVLYPGKLIYALLPYAWAARLYIIAHVALAFGAMLMAMRSWQVSWLGSGLAALTYTFGAPVLFQYCNVIFLVGAAWLPLGFLAVDRWVRLGSRPALLGLAIVLAMQTLGGDPQSAYLLGLCGCGYAVGVAWYRARKANGQEDEGTVEPGRQSYSWWLIAAVVMGLGSGSPVQSSWQSGFPSSGLKENRLPPCPGCFTSRVPY